jgi:hypothetical protein
MIEAFPIAVDTASGKSPRTRGRAASGSCVRSGGGRDKRARRRARARGNPIDTVVAHFHAKLRGSSRAPAIRGTADVFESSHNRTITVNLWRAGRLSGRRLALYVGGRLAGAMRVGSHGGAHFHGPVPRIRIGHYRVAVRTEQGVLVARGRLRLVNAP